MLIFKKQFEEISQEVGYTICQIQTNFFNLKKKLSTVLLFVKLETVLQCNLYFKQSNTCIGLNVQLV